MLRSCLRLTAVVLLVLVSAACAAKGSAPLQAAPMAVAAVPVTAPQTSSIQLDPVLVLIGLSTQHFESGERALQEGHLDTAKAEFDRALDVVLESTYGAQSEARIREHFTRLVERISAYEVAALALGDGFAESATRRRASMTCSRCRPATNRHPPKRKRRSRRT
jgi:hypothetical protein